MILFWLYEKTHDKWNELKKCDPLCENPAKVILWFTVFYIKASFIR